jgi:hypothetical protein
LRVIVDTSVWSLALRRRAKNLSPSQKALTFLLRDLVIDGDAILLGIVRQELLTGIADARTFESLSEHLRQFDDLPPEADDYERGASFANRCVRSGIAPGTVDMLICAIAVGRDLPILTLDDDFPRYAKVLPIRMHVHP